MYPHIPDSQGGGLARLGSPVPGLEPSGERKPSAASLGCQQGSWACVRDRVSVGGDQGEHRTVCAGALLGHLDTGTPGTSPVQTSAGSGKVSTSGKGWPCPPSLSQPGWLRICPIIPGLCQMWPNRPALALGNDNFHPWAGVRVGGDQSRLRARSRGRLTCRESTQASSV